MPSYKRKSSDMPSTSSRPYKRSKGTPARVRSVKNSIPTHRQEVRMMAEHKYVDTAAAIYGNDTTGTITHISIVPTGTSVNSRDGKNFRLTSVQIRGYLNAGDTGNYSSAMNLLVWDEQPNKALPAITDILDSVTSESFTKRENQQRFKIIRKWRYALTGNDNVAGQLTEASLFDIDDFVKLPSDALCACTAADTTGAIGNRITGALYFVTVGNKVNGTTSGTTNVVIRTNFQDC